MLVSEHSKSLNMIRLRKSAEEPDAGILLVRICGGLGWETAGPTRNSDVKIFCSFVASPFSTGYGSR